MEALSLETLVQYADYARFTLLSALVLFPRGWFVRLIVALFAGLELAYALATGADQTTIIWVSILLGLAVLILVGGILSRGSAKLTPEEQAMTTRLLKGVGRSSARHFMDQGYWLNGRPGEVLLREGEQVTQFCYLATGEARVMMAGRAIGFCRGCDVVGGMSFFTGEAAAATVVLATPARFWCAPAERLHAYFDAHPDLRRKIERSLGEPALEEAAAEEAVGPDDKAVVPAV